MLKLKAISELKQIIAEDYGVNLDEEETERIGINLLATFEDLIIGNQSNSKFITNEEN